MCFNNEICCVLCVCSVNKNSLQDLQCKWSSLRSIYGYMFPCDVKAPGFPECRSGLRGVSRRCVSLDPRQGVSFWSPGAAPPPHPSFWPPAGLAALLEGCLVTLPYVLQGQRGAEAWAGKRSSSVAKEERKRTDIQRVLTFCVRHHRAAFQTLSHFMSPTHFLKVGEWSKTPDVDRGPALSRPCSIAFTFSFSRSPHSKAWNCRSSFYKWGNEHFVSVSGRADWRLLAFMISHLEPCLLLPEDGQGAVKECRWLR